MLLLLAVATAPFAVVLALYVRWWWAGGHGPDCDPLPWRSQLTAIGQETVAMTIAMFRALRPRPNTGASTSPAAPEIVLLTGGTIAEAALGPLLDRLAARGCPTTHFRPTSWQMPVADAAAELDAFLRAQGRRDGITLIAYGTAGLIVRYYLRRYAAIGVRRVLTIATPHQGTGAPLIGFDSPPQPAAATMRQLAAGDRVPHQFDVIAIYSDFDAFIAPAGRGYYPGAFNIQVRGVGHFALARSQRLFELITENLASTGAHSPAATQEG
jgi:hypothetical protein